MGRFTLRLQQAEFATLAQSLDQTGSSLQDAVGKWKPPSHPKKEQNAHGERIGSKKPGEFI